MNYINIINAHYTKYRMSNNERPGERSGDPVEHAGPLTKKYISKAGESVSMPAEGGKLQDVVKRHDVLHPFRINNNPLSPSRGYISDSHFPVKTDNEHPHLQATRKAHEIYKLLGQHLPELAQPTSFLRKHGTPGINHFDEQGQNFVTITEDHLPVLKKKAMSGDEVSKGLLKKLVGHTVVIGPDEMSRAGITHILPPGIEQILERSISKKQRMSNSGDKGTDTQNKSDNADSDSNSRSTPTSSSDTNPFQTYTTTTATVNYSADENTSGTPEKIQSPESPESPEKQRNSKRRSKNEVQSLETPKPNDYVTQLEQFKAEDNKNSPLNSLKGLGKAFFATKGAVSTIMNSIYKKRLESFMRGQTKRYSSGMMRPSNPTFKEAYSQDYAETSGKPAALFQQDRLISNLSTIASQKGPFKEYLLAWHKLNHLKDGKLPNLDAEQLGKLKEEYAAFSGNSKGKAKGKAKNTNEENNSGVT